MILNYKVGVSTVRNGLKWMTFLTSAGMFLVLLGGALVTNTHAGKGCGDDWPLCNGKFVPAYTLESMIEYNHRVVTGMVGILVVITAIWVWSGLKKQTDAKLYAAGMLFFTLLQAALGAMAVMWQQSSAVLALHFGFSLLAFSNTLLLAVTVWRLNRIPRPEADSDLTGGQAVKISKGFRNLIWLITVYTYIVVYLGAFVRHTHSSGGCAGWPLCNGQWIPELTGATGIVFGHRVAAALLLLAIIWMAFLANSRYQGHKETQSLAFIILALALLQVMSGAWVSYTIGSEDVYIFSSLFHTVIISWLFGILCYASVRFWELHRQEK